MDQFNPEPTSTRRVACSIPFTTQHKPISMRINYAFSSLLSQDGYIHGVCEWPPNTPRHYSTASFLVPRFFWFRGALITNIWYDNLHTKTTSPGGAGAWILWSRMQACIHQLCVLYSYTARPTQYKSQRGFPEGDSKKKTLKPHREKNGDLGLKGGWFSCTEKEEDMSNRWTNKYMLIVVPD